MTQFDMFDTPAIANLRQEVDKLAKSQASVRRGLFGRHTQLEKYMIELQNQIESLEKEIYMLKKKLAEDVEECQVYEKIVQLNLN